ncbi:sigma-54 dependent transcriptional regulator [bacterium]|nr:sigma-54 dependent transcriptional regulator [bacterium]
MVRQLSKRLKILIVDDDEAVASSLALLFRQSGHSAHIEADPEAALRTIAETGKDPVDTFDLVFQDMNFSRKTTGEEGLSLLSEIKDRYPSLPVVLITAWGSIELAVKGMKAGAADFLTKPWTHERVLHAMNTTLGIARVLTTPTGSKTLTRDKLDAQYDFNGLIGKDAAFLSVLDVVGRVSRTEAPILITGESGTGKELIAEAIWRNSERKSGPLVKVNLGGIPGTLFESEMFGHVRGAFTDAKKDRAGRFESAASGTIFLDEIGDLELSSQVKLLRVLQDRTFEKVGSSVTQTANVRVISATNRGLPDLIEEGGFREDLFYRLNLISVHLPPLRERGDDIQLLARHFLEKLAKRYNRHAAHFDSSVPSWLSMQSWPGNVRQLRQVVERAVLLAHGEQLGIGDLQQAMDMQPAEKKRSFDPPVGEMTLDQLEKEMISAALARYSGHITKTAAALGISRAALYRKLEKHGMTP